MDNDYDDVPIYWAKGPCGPIYAEEGEDKVKHYECYECGNAVFARRAHKRRRNGIEHNVRAHFFHKSGTSACKGESAQHLAAKDAILRNTFDFYIPCGDCSADINIFIDGKRELETPWKEYRLDVGVKNEEGIVTGAIEILHTHAMEDIKIDALTKGGLAWCEITSSEVLSGKKRLKCVRCAETHCEKCKEQHKAQAVKDFEEKLEKITQEAAKRNQQLTYQHVIREHMEKLGVSSEEHQAWFLSGDLRVMPEFDYETLMNITGIEPDQQAIEQAKVRWMQVLEAIKKNTSSFKIAQQVHNQNVLKIMMAHELEIQRAAEDLLKASPMDVIDFGKYKGMTLSQVFHLEPRYIRWLAHWTGWRIGKYPEEFDISFTRHKDEARALLRGTCLLCFEDTGESWRNWCRGCYLESEK